MAGDLIPPPSPAGRPPADPVAESTAAAASPPALEPGPAPSPGPARTVRAPYPGRFGFVYGALAGIGVCAAALAVMLLGGGSGESSVRLAENWSLWKPATSEMVAVMLPPAAPALQEAEGPQALERQAVFFRPGDLLPQLQVPLVQTLSPRTPRERSLTGVESARVDALTQSNVFQAQLQQGQDAPYVVLEEPGGED